jgi:hypothetical protein
MASIVALTVFAVGGALCFKPWNAGDKIASATSHMGRATWCTTVATKAVRLLLLVGGDTRQHRNNLGGGNTAVASDAPSLKAPDVDLLPRSSWSGVRAGKSPVIFGFAGMRTKVVEYDAKIREGSHKGLRHLGDRVPSDRRRPVIDAQRPLPRVECGNARGIPTAPCGCVARREIPQVDRVRRHRARFYQ